MLVWVCVCLCLCLWEHVYGSCVCRWHQNSTHDLGEREQCAPLALWLSCWFVYYTSILDVFWWEGRTLVLPLNRSSLFKFQPLCFLPRISKPNTKARTWRMIDNRRLILIPIRPILRKEPSQLPVHMQAHWKRSFFVTRFECNKSKKGGCWCIGV